MNPSRKPSWRVVTQRLARAIVALAEAAAGGHDLVEQLRLELADQLGERRDVGVDPAGPVDDGRSLDDARQLGPERLGEAGHDPRHRRRVRRLGGPQLGRRSGCPGVARSRSIATRSAAGQSTSPCRAARSARRPRTVAAAPSAEPTRNPACQTRSSRQAGRAAVASGASLLVMPDSCHAGRGMARRAAAHDGDRDLDDATSGNASPKIRSATTRNASTSPVVSWRWVVARDAAAASSVPAPRAR